MTTKERLHQIIEELSPNTLEAAERLLEELRAEERGEITAEDKAWLESDLSHLDEFEPYDWGDDGPPAGWPIVYMPGRGPMVLLDDDGKGTRGQ